MTVAGHAKLKAEAKRLKSQDRPAIIAQIAEAREHGDLSENAEYHAAKERQGFIEARIKDLDYKLAHAQVIDPSTLSGDTVLFGATVTILNYETDQEEVWTIVGDDETDLKARRLGVSSPVARALIKKSIGDEVLIKTPKGIRQAEVMNVQFQAS